MRQLIYTVVYFLAFTPFALAQQPATTAAPQEQPSLGDLARKQRAQKAAQSDDAGAQGTKSLADIARERQAKKRTEIKITEKDSKELFGTIEQVLDFASQDSGLEKHAGVKYRLVSQDDVMHRWSEAYADSAATQRVARSELVLKKFGYLPRDFDLKKTIVANSGKEIAGYYDNQTKTMNLVNWVDLEYQRPIMAHELTHALQDQNYDLLKWRTQRAHLQEPRAKVDFTDSEEGTGRTAVIEGQAMIVFFDYLLRPYGRTLANTPEAIDFVQARMAETYDNSIVIHNAPLLLKDTSLFPYREGFSFELALLKKGGRDLAFVGTFARPPWDTHEILEPEAWLSKQKRPAVLLPDLSSLLAGKYEAYDSGTIGQLDVRIMAEQFGTENDMFTITPGWQGGSYVAVRRVPAPNDSATTTADLALLYVSQWKTQESAQRFAEVYRKSLAKRFTVKDENAPAGPACDASVTNCRALWASRVSTDEGPAFLEIWPKNMVIVSQSFNEETFNQLRQAVLNYVPDSKAKQTASSDLSLRLYEMPAFRALHERVQRTLLESFAQFQLK